MSGLNRWLLLIDTLLDLAKRAAKAIRSGDDETLEQILDDLETPLAQAKARAAAREKFGG